MEENLRQRAKKKLLRVTLSDGRVVCHRSVVTTFIEALSEIDSDYYDKIKMEVCHLPLFSKVIYPRFKESMKSVRDGWYVNTQSDSQQKYMQLTSIIKQLNLNMEVEIGDDFITSDEKTIQKSKKKDDKLLVRFPNGEYAAGDNPIDTLIDAIWQIGPEVIKRKELSYKNKSIITHTKTYNGQIQVGKGMWLVVPNSTKEKVKMLRIIDAMMRLGLKITLI